jgi:hypothetical protein
LFIAYIGTELPTFRDNPSVPSSTVKMGQICCPETFATKYQPMLRNNPEERRYLFVKNSPRVYSRSHNKQPLPAYIFILWIQFWSLKIHFNIVFTCKPALLNCLHTSGLPTNFYLLFISHINYSYLFLPSPIWLQNPNTVFQSIKLRSFLLYTSLKNLYFFLSLSLFKPKYSTQHLFSVTNFLCRSSNDTRALKQT